MRTLLKVIPVLVLALLAGLMLWPGSDTACGRSNPFRKRRFSIHLPYGYSVHGIDVSRYQQIIDWKKVAGAQEGRHRISFAWIKATQGIRLTDTCFSRNWNGSRRNGILRGAYHYLSPGLDAKAQALYFLSVAKPESGDLPPMLDVEEQGMLTRRQLQQKVKTWLEVVEKACGVKPVLYCSPVFYRNILEGQFPDYPLWLAHYYKYEITPGFQWTLWQHSDKGRVPGIEGPVDFNVFRGTLAELEALRIP